MTKVLLRNLLFLFALAACTPSAHNVSSQRSTNNSSTELVSENESGVDEKDSLLNTKPVSLMELPATEDGKIVLSEGFYESDFKSYCLQPGTPSPSEKDVYLQGPLSSHRKDIVETVLRNSLNKPQLEQRNIQLLLWSIVSGSDYNKLSWETQRTAEQLLTHKQIFELQGGVMGMIKKVSASMPDAKIYSANNTLKQLFETGSSSYEAFERIAVLRESSQIKHSGVKKDQWYKQDGGYFLRYFPSSYQQVKVQVYVPKGVVATDADNPLLFDPVMTMAIPANSNSQRLGIGAPIGDILRKIIIIQKTPAPTKKQPTTPKNPKIPT